MAGCDTHLISGTPWGLEPRSLGSGPFLFPTACAASQWTVHLLGEEFVMFDSFLERVSYVSFLGLSSLLTCDLVLNF